MAFEDTDRRRTLLLGLLTVVTLTAVYFFARSDPAAESSATSDVVVDGTLLDSADGARAASDNGPSRPPIEAPDDQPVYMDGPASDSEPGVAEVAVPARPDQPPIEMSASYRRSVGTTTCLIRDIGSGIAVTVRNLDNGRAIICTTAPAADNQVAGVVMSTEAFSLLADLTEAPIPVDVVQ